MFFYLLQVFHSHLSAWLQENDPLHVIVSVGEQSLKVYKGGEEIASSNVSTGKKGYSTPTGIFSILQKRRHHRSNIYRGASMPFMQRLTWSGIALHASNSVPRHPASHGCVRLPNGFARKLFSLTNSGAHVIIDDEPNFPEFVKHNTLFQPSGPLDLSVFEDNWAVEYLTENPEKLDARNDKSPLRIFITRRTLKQELGDAQRMLNELGYEAGDVDGLLGPSTQGAIRRFEKSQDRSETGRFDTAFMDNLYKAYGVERPSNGHIFVRKNFRKLFDAPVHIKGHNKPLGAHLLTTLDFKKGATSADWISVTLKDTVHGSDFDRSKNKIVPASKRYSVTDALDRIEIDPITANRIARLLTPKSSISISDNGLSQETFDKGTDFIVLTKPKVKNPEA